MRVGLLDEATACIDHDDGHVAVVHLRCREMQGDAGRCREMQGDRGRYREM